MSPPNNGLYRPVGLSLTARQRDFLASFPDEVVVDILESVDGVLHIYTDDAGAGFMHQEFWVPKEGFPDQPIVVLTDREDP